MELLIYLFVSFLISLGMTKKIYSELREFYGMGLFKSILVSIGFLIFLSITRPCLVGCAIAKYLPSTTK